MFTWSPRSWNRKHSSWIHLCRRHSDLRSADRPTRHMYFRSLRKNITATWLERPRRSDEISGMRKWAILPYCRFRNGRYCVSNASTECPSTSGGAPCIRRIAVPLPTPENNYGQLSSPFMSIFIVRNPPIQSTLAKSLRLTSRIRFARKGKVIAVEEWMRSENRAVT